MIERPFTVGKVKINNHGLGAFFRNYSNHPYFFSNYQLSALKDFIYFYLYHKLSLDLFISCDLGKKTSKL